MYFFCITFMEKCYGGVNIMQITSCKIENNSYMQIYLTEEEFEKKETKEIIKKYKAQKYNIAIFINGKENYPEILKRIITKQVEIPHDLC